MPDPEKFPTATEIARMMQANEAVARQLATFNYNLERIATALERLSGDKPVNRYGENFSDAIQNSIVRGQNGISTD